MKITICISTYNGISFFEEQIKSILKQSYTNYDILIRDDGSTDNQFIELLKRYSRDSSKISIYFEENIGLTQSFFRILKKCSLDTDMVVLADQDDVWDSKRLEKTVKFFKDKSIDKPMMSFCRLEYVDENLNHISYSPVFKNVGFKNALVQNLATGCGIAINKLALDSLIKHVPRHAIIHDWWMYLVISALGKVFQEPNISIKYRQHSNNVLGGTTSFFPKNKKRLQRKLYNWIYKAYEQDNELLHEFINQISRAKRSKINRFLRTSDSRFYKILFLFNFNTIKREKLFDNLALKLIILTSRKHTLN